jgi:outer membrane receptor protein involved in Fe transport
MCFTPFAQVWRRFGLLAALTLCTLVLSAQRHTLSGYVEDAHSAERLAGANVLDTRGGGGVASNNHGFFSLRLASGDSAQVSISHVGYRTLHFQARLRGDTLLVFRLRPALDLEPVEVSEARAAWRQGPGSLSSATLSGRRIERVPALLGEADALRVLQLLPGVQGGGEGQTGLMVRGGGPDQNLILLDGVPVYNANHLYGFFSVFNTDLIQDVTLIKGGFPARYAGRLSSIVDIRLREGDLRQWKASANVGLLAAKLRVEGPIRPDKASVIFSLRHSTLHWLAQPFVDKLFAQQGALRYLFHDLNFKVNFQPSARDRLFVSLYQGADNYGRQDRLPSADTAFTHLHTALGWGNTTAVLRWNRAWSPILFSNLTLTHSRFAYRAMDHSFFTLAKPPSDSILSHAFFDLRSGIDDAGARLDFDFAAHERHFLRWGISLIRHRFNPGAFHHRYGGSPTHHSGSAQLFIPDFDTLFRSQPIQALEWGLYLEDEARLGQRLRINAGAHLSAWQVDGTFQAALQPRLAMELQLPRQWNLQASFAEMWQYVHLLTQEGVGLPTDLWLPSTSRVRPQRGWQSAIGLARPLGPFALSVEGFYRRMSNPLNYRPGATITQTLDWQSKIIQGLGQAHGAEFLARKESGRLSGWLSYTLSWSTRQFHELNLGRPYPFRYDRRHDLAIIAQWTLSPQWRFSANWVFASGHPVTLPSARYIIPCDVFHVNECSYVVLVNPQRNNFRLPNFHRLDLGMEYSWGGDRWRHTLSASAYNAYNRKNPFYLILTDASASPSTMTPKLQAVSLFPLIPSLSYRLAFGELGRPGENP